MDKTKTSGRSQREGRCRQKLMINGANFINGKWTQMALRKLCFMVIELMGKNGLWPQQLATRLFVSDKSGKTLVKTDAREQVN